MQKGIDYINKKGIKWSYWQNEEDFYINLNMPINKRLSKDVIRNDTNIKRNSFFCVKNKI